MAALSYAPRTLTLVTEIIARQREHNAQSKNLNVDCHANSIPKPLSIDVNAGLEYIYSDDETTSCLEFPGQNNIVDFAPLNLRNCVGETPFLVASKSCNLVGMKLLVSEENVNFHDNYSVSALHNVCENNQSDNHHEALLYLIRHGAEVNAQNMDSRTPLHIAAIKGCLECIQTLLKNGGCPSMADANGNTALHLVADRHDQITLIGTLSNAEVCSSSCLHCANTVNEGLISETETRTTDHLSQKIIEPLACIENASPLSRTLDVEDAVPLKDKSLEIWDAFFQNMRAESQLARSSSPLPSTTYKFDSDKEVMLFSSEEKTTLLVDNDGNSSLHQAALRGDKEHMRFLLQGNTQINVRNNKNQTALGICFEKGFIEGSNLILKYSHRKETARKTSRIEDDHCVHQSILDNDSLFFHLAIWIWSVVMQSFLSRFFYPATQRIFKKTNKDSGVQASLRLSDMKKQTLQIPEDIQTELRKKHIPPDVLKELKKLGLR